MELLETLDDLERLSLVVALRLPVTLTLSERLTELLKVGLKVLEVLLEELRLPVMVLLPLLESVRVMLPVELLLALREPVQERLLDGARDAESDLVWDWL